MKVFYHLLGNSLLVATKNNFVWFALIFWLILETQSVISTAVAGGMYMLISAFSSFWLGSLVDHYKKKTVLIVSSVMTLVFFALAFMMYLALPESVFTSVSSPHLWIFSLLILLGVIAANVLSIAVPTLVTVLVDAENRDKANGLFGTVMGIAFAITSVASGIVLAYGGMWWVLLIAILLTFVSIAHLVTIKIPEKEVIHVEGSSGHQIDIKGTIKLIQSIPGMFALIFFTTFNNFLGGAFMALMDAYGLSLVTVQTWGLLWGGLSFGFILGGMYIAKKGLGKNPLRNLFRVNIIMWIVCIFFTIQPSILLLVAGLLVWICLVPFVEATEQTIIQKVVPQERQGRVFGFAHSIEQAASPLTAFVIGPITQWFFIPFMTDGAGARIIGPWFGVGPGRGIALVFTVAGMIGLMVTLFAMRSKAYKLLHQRFSE